MTEEIKLVLENKLHKFTILSVSTHDTYWRFEQSSYCRVSSKLRINWGRGPSCHFLVCSDVIAR